MSVMHFVHSILLLEMARRVDPVVRTGALVIQERWILVSVSLSNCIQRVHSAGYNHNWQPRQTQSVMLA